jgi:hypothetical protein
MTFEDYIEEHLNTPFEWGVFDCIIFCIGWAAIATGRQLLPAITWINQQEAMDAIQAAGGIETVFDIEFNRIEPNYALDGDLTLIGTTVFMFCGAQLVGTGTKGLTFRTRMDVTIAWSTHV